MLWDPEASMHLNKNLLRVDGLSFGYISFPTVDQICHYGTLLVLFPFSYASLIISLNR